ncbi:anti-sigma factor [Pontibacter korlensis]|uniref:Uncharacterized protein n=1 Tax=Pontibacter korlensis TaxID=400092 RepID=A0A0E3UXZ7_9BACT|nr:anti-sigma factor [Pontibacter korlensis]AKD04692.1 hypothetical protein PKOR_18300 [Pontibacter korlensis]
MRPEDIDKLFKERLGNNTPTPPGDLWSRLQERMEAEETPAPVVLTPEAEQKEGKRRFMWVYSSVAATLSLLLAVGVVFYNINTGTPEINETITKYDVKLPQETPANELVEPKQKAATTEGMMAENEEATEENPETEKNVATQATADQNAASTITNDPIKQKAIAEARPKAIEQKQNAKAPVGKLVKQDAQTAIAAHTTPETSAIEVAPAKESAGFAKADLNAEPVEIIIKRALATQTALADETEAVKGSSKKKELAKNIFKQVRNLASGDGVELEELGIRADRVALETQIGKQKISKVINL